MVMGELTTLVGQLDGLRVAVTQQVRQRELYRQRGAGNVVGWLRADPRTADAAWQLSRLASVSQQLPRITSLLETGQVSLAQAGTACWQISQLPDLPTRPDDMDPATEPPNADLQDESPQREGLQPPEDERWAGLWRSGDVHAAADDLFARFLPDMGADQVRVMGAHLREAADAQERTAEDYDAFTKRTLRISRSFGGVAELSGRLHPEAADQLIAAFEELGAKTGPSDDRTKAQRWADVLSYITGLAYPATAAPVPPPPGQHAEPHTSDPAADCSPAEGDDDQPSPDGGHGHPLNPDPGHPPSPGYPSDPGHPPGSGHPSGPSHSPRPDPDSDSPPGPGPTASPDQVHARAPGFAGPPQTQAPSSAAPHARPPTAPPGLRRPRVIVTVPFTTLLGYPLVSGAVLGTSTPITAEAARRLSCDADIIRLITAPATSPTGAPLSQADLDATAQLTSLLAEAIRQLPRPLGGPSAVLDIGRASQSWTPRQRDALHALYGGRCARPGCTHRIDVIHHIVHWLHGGRTQITNGAPLCLYDHWLVHEGGWQITRQPDTTLTFHPPAPGWRPGTLYRHGKPVPDTA